MRYDFDMFSIIPDEVRQIFQGELNDLGMGTWGLERVALFRDPATAQALQSADEDVQQLFKDAGFGMNCYDSGAPDGRYLARDAEQHERCFLQFLSLSHDRADELVTSNWGGLNLIAFVEAVNGFQPIDEIEISRAAPPKAGGRKLAVGVLFLVGTSLLIGFALIMLAQRLFLN